MNCQSQWGLIHVQIAAWTHWVACVFRSLKACFPQRNWGTAFPVHKWIFSQATTPRMGKIAEIDRNWVKLGYFEAFWSYSMLFIHLSHLLSHPKLKRMSRMRHHRSPMGVEAYHWTCEWHVPIRYRTQISFHVVSMWCLTQGVSSTVDPKVVTTSLLIWLLQQSWVLLHWWLSELYLHRCSQSRCQKLRRTLRKIDQLSFSCCECARLHAKAEIPFQISSDVAIMYDLWC